MVAVNVFTQSSNAKAVYDALLDLFVDSGVPKVTTSDCEINFTRKLTQEMLRKLGFAPRFLEWLNAERCRTINVWR